MNDTSRAAVLARSPGDSAIGPEVPTSRASGGVSGRNDGTTLNILFLSTSAGEGGAEREAIRVAEEIQARGHTAHFYCRADSFSAQFAERVGLTPVPLRPANSGDLSTALRLARTLREKQINILHAHGRRDFTTAGLAIVLARRPASRLILHSHMARRMGDLPRISGAFFARTTSAVIAVSDFVREVLIQYHALPPSLVRRIYNGAHIEKYPERASPAAREARRRMRDQWGVPQDAFVIGMLGNLATKGQKTMVEVAPLLKQCFPKVHFVFVGPEGLRGGRRQLEECIAAREAVRDCIHLPGPQDDVSTALMAFDLFVHLPDEEAFGLASVEAMCADLPVIVTDLGGSREVVTEGVTGYRVTLGDTVTLLQHLFRLLDPTDGPALRAVLGAAGRKVAGEQFTRERQITEIENLYREVLER